MLNSFTKAFGPPYEIVIAIRDWSIKHSMRFQEPIKGKSMRNLFRRRGYYTVLLVDEYSTSKM